MRRTQVTFELSLVLILLTSFELASSASLGVWEQKFEGELADVYFGVEKVCDNTTTKNTGYTGEGYADFGAGGSFVEWNIKNSFDWPIFDVGAHFDIFVRYSSPNKRGCSLYVDNVRKGDFSIVPTGTWNDWKDSIPITISLEERIRQIRIVATGAAGPNIDFLSIRASGEVPEKNYGEDENESTSRNNDVSNSAKEIQHEEVQEEVEQEENTMNSATIFKQNTILFRGRFISSPSGLYKMELVYSTGELVIKYNPTNTTTWSNGVLGGEFIIMQGDGNLVVRNSDNVAIWTTKSSGHNSAQLTIDDNGIASIIFDSVEIWTSGGFESIDINNKIQVGNNPNSKQFPETLVLNSPEILRKGKYVSSPSDRFRIGLDNLGNLALQDLSHQTTIWSANVEGCDTATMQNDGNFVLRDDNNTLVWTTHTSDNPGARLVIDDGGRLSLQVGKTPIWMEGIPRGIYSGKPSSPSLQYPLRGMFYYPWYPETWNVNNQPTKFIPDLGKYSSDDTSVVEEHIDAMEYAYTDVAIASWWGPGKNQELSRITVLMDKTFEMKSSIKWTVYYEDEMFRNPSVDKIRSDLNYLKKWFIWHPTWAFIDDKPVIFVYNDSGCSINKRWMEAAGDDWYVVMKVFRNFRHCEYQPDSYHQYGPSTAYQHIEGVSSTVSPGFWRADHEEPKLPRLSKEEFCSNTKLMVESGENWNLVTTFNEAGEGTLVEASSENWGSETKYGFYLDCLHEHH